MNIYDKILRKLSYVIYYYAECVIIYTMNYFHTDGLRIQFLVLQNDLKYKYRKNYDWIE